MTQRAPRGHRHDVWADAAPYERYIGRWGRLVAREFVPWLGMPPGARWVDVGCGSGALTSLIVELAAPSAVLGVEPSAPFREHARATVQAPVAAFAAGDAAALPVADGSGDAIVAGLVLNFVPDVPAALREWRRATRPGGTLGGYVWDYAEGMQMLRRFWDAAVALDPAAAALDEGPRFPITRRAGLLAAFETAGLVDVTTRAIDVPTRFRDFDDFWQPFLGGQGPAAAYVVELPVERRDALRDRVRASLPIESDGSIPLTARAWAVKGRNP